MPTARAAKVDGWNVVLDDPRFVAVCETEFKGHDLIPRVVVKSWDRDHELLELKNKVI